jgi:hypothetical protein
MMVARRNWGARLHEVTWDGAPAVVLENERLRVTVCLAGGHVMEFNDKRRDLDLVWLNPNGRAPLDAGTGFFDTYPGGWQEVLPNGGAPARYRGAGLDQHAELVGLRWDCAAVADEESEVAVRLSARCVRTPLLLRKVLRLRRGEPRLTVEEELVNEAPVAVHAMWGQHLAYGAPFLRPGYRIRLPDGVRVLPHPEPINPPRRTVAAGGPYPWPLVPAPGGGRTDLSVVPAPGAPSDIVYLTGFSDGWYELIDPDSGTGVRVEWDTAVLPYLWLWHELGATVDHPWWGRAYVVGVEPFSSYPTDGLPAAVGNGSALPLHEGQARTLAWSIGVIGDG